MSRDEPEFVTLFGPLGVSLDIQIVVRGTSSGSYHTGARVHSFHVLNPGPPLAVRRIFGSGLTSGNGPKFVALAGPPGAASTI